MFEPSQTYEDILGERVPYDGHSPVTWRVSAYTVVVRDDALLMVEPVWASRLELPGGGIELQTHETLVEGATRECWEETGYQFTPTEQPSFFAESRFLLWNPERYCHSLMFAVRGSVSVRPDPDWRQDPEEIQSVCWIPLASLQQEKLHPLHRDALRAMSLL